MLQVFQKVGPLAVTTALVVIIGAWYAVFLPSGSLQHGDEYLTLDRAASFMRHHDWLTVFSNNAPTFKKPPLQYWASAALMAADLDLELALRLPSFVFGLGVLGATAWLAFIVMPGNRWAMPLATLLVACSERFWEVSVSALLDSGATFFATIALAGTYFAIRKPSYWWVVALACGIGALHKAPTPLLFALIPVVVLSISGKWSGTFMDQSLRTKHFAGACVLLLVLLALWPGLQWFRHGPGSLQEAYMQQMVDRFSPFGDAASSSRRQLFSLFADGEPIPRVLGLAALCWLPFSGGRREFLAFPVMLGLYAIAVSFATGYVSPRYSLLFLPMMMVALATALLSLSARFLHRALLNLVVILLAAGPIKSAHQIGITAETTSRHVPLIRSVGVAVRPEESLVYCGRSDGEELLYGGALSFYANVDKTWIRVRQPEELAAMVTAGSILGPLRGLCAASQFDRLVPLLDGPQVVERTNGIVHWTARGVRR